MKWDACDAQRAGRVKRYIRFLAGQSYCQGQVRQRQFSGVCRVLIVGSRGKGRGEIHKASRRIQGGDIGDVDLSAVVTRCVASFVLAPVEITVTICWHLFVGEVVWIQRFACLCGLSAVF